MEVQTDDGRNWLKVTPAGGSAVIDQPAVVQVTADAQGLPSNSYVGSVRIQSGTQAPIVIPVVFAVGSQTTGLRTTDTALNWRVNRNYTEFPTQTLELVATGGTVNWQAKSSASWLRVSPSSGRTATGTIGSLNIDLNLNQLQDGSNKGLLTLDSDSGNGQISIPVEVQMLPASQPVLRVEPAGMAFVAPSFPTRKIVFVASTFGRIAMSTTKPNWLKVTEIPRGGPGQSTIHDIQVTIAKEGLPSGEDGDRGVITLQDPNNGAAVNVSVLVYIPGGSLGNVSPASSKRAVPGAACSPRQSNSALHLGFAEFRTDGRCSHFHRSCHDRRLRERCHRGRIRRRTRQSRPAVGPQIPW